MYMYKYTHILYVYMCMYTVSITPGYSSVTQTRTILLILRRVLRCSRRLTKWAEKLHLTRDTRRRRHRIFDFSL